jgi:hypothetical protein
VKPEKTASQKQKQPNAHTSNKQSTTDSRPAALPRPIAAALTTRSTWSAGTVFTNPA